METAGLLLLLLPGVEAPFVAWLWNIGSAIGNGRLTQCYAQHAAGFTAPMVWLRSGELHLCVNLRSTACAQGPRRHMGIWVSAASLG